MSGGIFYHYRAARHSGTRWNPFRTAISGWLERWQPARQKLVLFGPSAGYCVPGSFLGRFERIVGIEPDPLARWIFARRHAGVRSRLNWDLRDYVREISGGFRLDGPRLLAEVYPADEWAILFCNSLGQLGLDVSGDYARWLGALTSALSTHEWASFHDRVSASGVRGVADSGGVEDRGLGNGELARRFFSDASNIERSRRVIECVDHLTEPLSRTDGVVDRDHYLWELEPGTWHVIEAVRHSPESAGS